MTPGPRCPGGRGMGLSPWLRSGRRQRRLREDRTLPGSGRGVGGTSPHRPSSLAPLAAAALPKGKDAADIAGDKVPRFQAYCFGKYYSKNISCI